jgi:hypothetical protein
MNKQYLGLNFKQPFSTGQQLVLDFNGYNSRLDQVMRTASTRAAATPSGAWRRAISGIFTPSKWRTSSSGSTGYNYGGYRDQGGVGDGGNTIWLANSYWSDFNGEDERSWQASYGLDFAGLGLPG